MEHGALIESSYDAGNDALIGAGRRYQMVQARFLLLSEGMLLTVILPWSTRIFSVSSMLGGDSAADSSGVSS